MDAATVYRKGKEEHARTLAVLEGRSRALAATRLAVAVAVVGLLGVEVWAHAGSWPGLGLGLLVSVFVVLVFVHASVHKAIERASAALRFHERGLARLDLDWDRLPATSSRFRSADHPFASDLDLFGRASVMQVVDATVTLFGEVRLAALLSADGPGAWPDDVRARQGAVKDLATRAAFREALATAGGILADERPDAASLLRWAESTGNVAPLLAVVGWVVPVLVAALVAFGPSLGVPTGVVTLVVTGALALGIAVGRRLSPMLGLVSRRESAATRWRSMIALVEGEAFEAPALAGLHERLLAGGRKASDAIAALERIVGFVDARGNEVFRLLIGPLLMWDVHCAAALLRWRRQNGARLRGWLDVLGEVEALGSLGTFAFEHPEFAWPELAPEPVLEAQALGHPLIAAGRRVGNDVELPSSGRAWVITGSNMSGKSTFLRAIGVNTALGFAGAPVCARAMRLGPARIATSIRIEDSLEQGVSHFYAELRRLKSVLDRAATGQPPPVLFLLDEILHGTNSRERVIGACAVVKQLLATGALGAVSTHDLGITALEEELGGVVQNAHFEEQVTGDAMTFDYVLRPGIVKSSNALRLMEALGIKVGG